VTEQNTKVIEQYIRNATVKLAVDGVFRGTGFFISREGYVLTAYHCVGAEPGVIQLETPFDGVVAARLEPDKSLPAYDLAILKADHQPSYCLPLGTITNGQIGDKVVAVGYPASHLDLNQEAGIYKGDLSRWRKDDLVELTDAIKGKGHSGGSVYHYDSRRVVGVVTDRYKEGTMVDSGLATRLERLFAKWPELEDLNQATAKQWDKNLRNSGYLQKRKYHNEPPKRDSTQEESQTKEPIDAPETPDWYVERPPIESICYQTIAEPGSLLRIKAPKQMGKTLLLDKVIRRARQQGYLAAYLSLNSLGGTFANLDRLLQEFCAQVSNELGWESQVGEFWDEMDSSKVNCSVYFEECLFPNADRALVLCLDNIDLVFPHGEIAQDFLGLLRAWHEKANSRPLWQKLRLVVAHSSEVYIKISVEESPFNVGRQIELPEFTSEQMLEFARKYGLDLTEPQIEQLQQMVGGHPELVKQAIDRLKSYRNETLEQLLQNAPTAGGIYSKHLRGHWRDINKDPELKDGLKKVVASPKGVRLDPTLTYKLQLLGLIEVKGNDCIPRCELYRLYFSENLEDS